MVDREALWIQASMDVQHEVHRLIRDRFLFLQSQHDVNIKSLMPEIHAFVVKLVNDTISTSTTNLTTYHKIRIIKAVYDKFPVLGLKEAKNIVEKYMK